MNSWKTNVREITLHRLTLMKCSHLNSLDKGVLIVTSDEATSVANVGIVHFE